jgi:hypothetical protein
MMLIWLDAQLIIYPLCVIWIVAYLEWLINYNLMLKLESKDSLLDTFWKKLPSAKSLACLEVG